MRFLRRSLVGLFLLAVTFGLMTYAGSLVWDALQARWSDEPGQRPARERVFAANVVTIAPETIRPVLSAFGEVRSRRTLEMDLRDAGQRGEQTGRQGMTPAAVLSTRPRSRAGRHGC